jgi:predicted RND superfamily exporter protein
MHRFIILLFRWSTTRPFAAIGVAVALSLAFASGFAFVRIDASMEHFLSPEDPEVRFLHEARENFGDRPVMLLLVRSERLASPVLLETLRETASSFETIEGVARVSSLFNLRLPVPDDTVVRDAPALPGIPRDEAEARRILDRLLTRNIVVDNFVNRAGNALVIVVFLEPEASDGANHRHVIDELESRRARAEESIGDLAELTLLGAPLMKVVTERYILRDLLLLGPIALLVIGGIIFLFFRSPATVFLPLVTGSLSVFATLGFMGWAGFEFSVFLSTIVVLLLVVGCTEDLHILSDHLDNLREGMENLDAIREVGRSLGRALILTMTTTTLGFLSIAFTDFEGLQHFAISCAFGMTVNFLITILVVPAYLSLFPRRAGPPGSGAGRGWLARVESLLQGTLRRRPGPALALLALMLAGAGLGVSRLEVNTDYLRFFRDDSEIVQSYRRFYEAFGGANYLTVTAETGEINGFENHERLAKLRQFQDSLAPECGHPIGYLNLLDEYLAASPPTATGPDGLPTLDTLRAFRKRVPREVLKPFLDYDGSRTAIRLRIHAPTSEDVLRLETRILELADAAFGSDIEVRVAGDLLVIGRLCERVTAKLFTNLVILSLTVAFLIGLSVRSPAIGLLAILPNLFPVLVTLGAMGWLGIPMSVGTFPVTLVAFGVTVDDTIHLLARHHLERKRGGTVIDAVSRGLSRELRPVLATSIIVAAGYLVMMLSPFRVNAEVGLLFAIAMLSGVVADLVLTPILLARFDRSMSRETA